jgi:hypothetical protein
MFKPLRDSHYVIRNDFSDSLVPYSDVPSFRRIS